jgi:co-chaperonin GroES (HSP10)
MNNSGIRPVESKVLICPEMIKELAGDLIIKPMDTLKKEGFERTRGTIIAVGAIAFTEPNWLDCPKPGDDVLFDKYAQGSSNFIGNDGREYWLIHDSSIFAIFT